MVCSLEQACVPAGEKLTHILSIDESREPNNLYRTLNVTYTNDPLSVNNREIYPRKCSVHAKFGTWGNFLTELVIRLSTDRNR